MSAHTRKQTQPLPSGPVRRGASPQDALAIFDAVAAENGLSTFNGQDAQLVLEKLAALVMTASSWDHLVYGKRTEKMFGYVAHALSPTATVAELDAGDVHYSTKTRKMVPPDYQVATENGTRFYVEVKNWHKKLDQPFRIRKQDLKPVLDYVRAFPHPLYIAIFWSLYEEWILVPPDAMQEMGPYLEIDFGRGLAASYMSKLLGDERIGTKIPLSFRLLADLSKPRRLSPKGDLKFVIDQVDILCAGRVLKSERDKRLAIYLLFNGRWGSPRGFQPLFDEHGNVNGAQLDFQPEDELQCGHGFETVGSVSGMVSHQFKEMTSGARGVTRLQPSHPPSALVPPLPQGDDADSDALPLWRFRLEPNHHLATSTDADE